MPENYNPQTDPFDTGVHYFIDTCVLRSYLVIRLIKLDLVLGALDNSTSH